MSISPRDQVTASFPHSSHFYLTSCCLFLLYLSSGLLRCCFLHLELHQHIASLSIERVNSLLCLINTPPPPPLVSLQPKHQDTFSLAPQRPLTTINPIGHSLHPNGASTLKPSPVHRTIQAMPWEQRSLYNQ